MVKPILIVHDGADAHVDAVARQFLARGVEFATVDLAVVDAGSVGVMWHLAADGSKLCFERRGRRLCVQDARSVWLRPLRSRVPKQDQVERPRAEWLGDELRYGVGGALLASCVSALPSQRWLNPPTGEYFVNHRLFQLEYASRFAQVWNVPESAYTNDSQLSADLCDKNQRVLAKAVRSAADRHDRSEPDPEQRIGDGTRELPIGTLQAEVKAGPLFLQRRVTPAMCVKIVVVGDYSHGIEFDSERPSAAEFGWRRFDRSALSYRIHPLSTSLADAAVRYCRELDLNFGILDLVVDMSGRYWFIEVNPRGDWLELELLTHAPISRSVASWLAHDDSRAA